MKLRTKETCIVHTLDGERIEVSQWSQDKKVILLEVISLPDCCEPIEKTEALTVIDVEDAKELISALRHFVKKAA